MRNILIKAVSLMLLIACFFVTDYSFAYDRTQRVPISATDFTLEAVEGEKVTLSEVLKEKKAVLIFWASWCFFCRKELPQAERFYRENRDKATVLGIDVGESKAKAQGALKKMGISYPTLLDSDSHVAQLYGVFGVPTVVAVDKNNQILYYGHSVEEMASQVEF